MLTQTDRTEKRAELAVTLRGIQAEMANTAPDPESLLRLTMLETMAYIAGSILELEERISALETKHGEMQK